MRVLYPKMQLIILATMFLTFSCQAETTIANNERSASLDVSSTPNAESINKCEQLPNSMIFPLKGTQAAFTGKTSDTVPKSPGDYVIAKEADWYFEWPTPLPEFSYIKFRGRKVVTKNQEPGFYACRPSSSLPRGCARPHRGVDIYAHYGTPIVAPEEGRICAYAGAGVFSPAGTESKNGGVGRVFRLCGESGYVYTFMHTMGLTKEIAKQAGIPPNFGNSGERAINVHVMAGDIIGYVGTTGGIINPHLHFHVAKAGKDVNLADLKP
jgi:murein DD-endopeptidase MepM/ murein hydrolase activator NlpD